MQLTLILVVLVLTGFQSTLAVPTATLPNDQPLVPRRPTTNDQSLQRVEAFLGQEVWFTRDLRSNLPIAEIICQRKPKPLFRGEPCEAEIRRMLVKLEDRLEHLFQWCKQSTPLSSSEQMSEKDKNCGPDFDANYRLWKTTFMKLHPEIFLNFPRGSRSPVEKYDHFINQRFYTLMLSNKVQADLECEIARSTLRKITIPPSDEAHTHVYTKKLSLLVNRWFGLYTVGELNPDWQKVGNLYALARDEGLQLSPWQPGSPSAYARYLRKSRREGKSRANIIEPQNSGDPSLEVYLD